MQVIKDNEQWKLDGDCNKCRKNYYCKTECSRKKRRVGRTLAELIIKDFKKNGK